MSYVPIRLTPAELADLDKLIVTHNAVTRSAVLRLLLHKETARCNGLPKPKDKDWRSVYRIGAKKKEKI